MNNSDFKTCLVCKTSWPTRHAFITDEEIRLIGYQAHFAAAEKGLFLFNHTCLGTLSIKAEAFTDLYAGPIYTERKTGTEECLGYCLRQNILHPCPVRCECAYVREILQFLARPEGNQTLPSTRY